VPCLSALIGAGYELSTILTQPDRPAGRGRRLAAPPVKALALEHGLTVLQPGKIDSDLAARLAGLDVDLLVVVAYGLLLPQWLLDWPNVAPVNVHASLLPRWRGAAPIQQSILAGDSETGVSLMRMTRGLDCGPVYARRSTPIDDAETGGELHDRLATLGAALLIDSLPGILSGDLLPEPQDDSAATYAGKIEKGDAQIDWGRPASELVRQVRAYNPWPVAETTLPDGGRLRIWRAEVVPGGTERPGAVVATGNAGIDVATGRDLLRLTEVQPPGGRAMSARAWLAAHSLDGAALGARA